MYHCLYQRALPLVQWMMLITCPTVLARNWVTSSDFLFLTFYIQITAKSWKYKLLNAYLISPVCCLHTTTILVFSCLDQRSALLTSSCLQHLFLVLIVYPVAYLVLFFLPWLLRYYCFLVILPFLICLLSSFASSLQFLHLLNVVLLSVLSEASIFHISLSLWVIPSLSWLK